MTRPATPVNPAQLLQDALGFHRQNRLDEAEKLYARVLKIHRDHFDALHLYGMLNLQRGKTGEAYRLVTAALKVQPRSPDALSNLGLVLHALKRDAEALKSIDQALAIAPGHLEGLNNRGNVLLALQRPDDARKAFEQVLAQNPRHVQARTNRGNALAALGQPEQALADYDAALALLPQNPNALYNRGNALRLLGREADAIASYDRALALHAQHAGAWHNRALAQQALNRHQDALASFAKAIAVQPDYGDAHFSAALSMLTLGDYARGFAEYEWRWKRIGMGARRSFRQPLWLGEYPLAHKTILIHAEQGLGDTIMFARYAPLLARAGAKVVLEVQPELKPLLASLDGVAAVVARGEPLPAFDVQCPLASLPLAMKTALATVPAEIPYLRADEARIAKWRERLAPLAAPRVALAWSGRVTHINDRNRSVTLAALEPLLAVEGVRFVSIQHELRDADAAALAAEPRITHLGGELADFSDTAAVLALSDLVICVDTSIAHLSGALGRPTWVLLPFQPDWRWTLGETSPWYPQLRLFRQPKPGDWANVFNQLTETLASSGMPVT
jgi:tetratricopeptide (TPR) repeat protein